MPKAKLVTDINNTYFTNNKVTVGTSAPTTGTYVAGDMVISSSANSNAFGWICTASGTPGSWKVLKSGTDVTNINWNNIIERPGTYPPDIGTTSTTAFRGDHGSIAYNHSQSAHAPVNAQRNADITKAEIEAKLTGVVTSHSHNNYVTNGYGELIENVNSELRSRSGFFHGSAVANGMPGGVNWKYYINIAHPNSQAQYTGTIAMDFGGDVLGFKTVYAGTDKGWKYIYHTGNRPTAADVGALPITGGNISGNVTASAWRLNIHGGNCYIGNGNGDAANYNEHNVIIRSWYGIGFRDNLDVCRTVLNTRTGDLSTKGYIHADNYMSTDNYMSSGKFIVNGVGEWGANYICGGNGDAANYDYHNIVIRSWYGIGFRDYENICRTVLNTRTGDLQTKGALHSSSYLSSPNLYLDDIRIRPYSTNGVSIIKPGGAEFAGLEVKELWLGPHSGATRLFTMSPSAPSSPSHGDVWIQNG